MFCRSCANRFPILYTCASWSWLSETRRQAIFAVFLWDELRRACTRIDGGWCATFILCGNIEYRSYYLYLPKSALVRLCANAFRQRLFLMYFFCFLLEWKVVYCRLSLNNFLIKLLLYVGSNMLPEMRLFFFFFLYVAEVSWFLFVVHTVGSVSFPRAGTRTFTYPTSVGVSEDFFFFFFFIELPTLAAVSFQPVFSIPCEDRV